MVQMIPPVIGDDAPPGERALFTALAEAPDTDDWIALHSLRLAKHRSQQRGEADFVVIAPGHGVAVVEVKSHRSVARDGAGRWLLGRSAPATRSPFEQADGAKFAISEFLGSQLGMTAVHIEACVWFTHVPARRELPASIEWPAFQLLDATDLARDPIAALIAVMAAGRKHRAAAGHTWPNIVGPDAAQARSIASALRPALHVEPAPADVRRARDSELVRLLAEQLDVFDGLLGNPRVLVTGPAGCGKTFLALEAAREEARRGRRGLLVCFNHALSLELAEATRDIAGLTVRTLASVMLDASELEPRPDTDRVFWEEQLPAVAWEALVEQGTQPADYLIVDEVQDVCLPGYLEVLDLLVAGGLAEGRCLLFGDFDDQAIYSGLGERAVPLSRLGWPATFAVRTNCRNTRAIADRASEFGGGRRYARCRRSGDGTSPEVREYRDADEQQRLLVAAVREARAAGFDLAEIVVLSRYRASAAALCQDPWLAPLLVDYRRGGLVTPGRVRYSTIHSFKGLEAPAVILTDINEASHGPYNDLVTVGITRARDWLTMLATSEGLAQLQDRPS